LDFLNLLSKLFSNILSELIIFFNSEGKKVNKNDNFKINNIREELETFSTL
jgi:hypothetical protein